MYMPSLGFCGLLALLLHGLAHGLEKLAAQTLATRLPSAPASVRPLRPAAQGRRQGEWDEQVCRVERVARVVLVLAVSAAYGRLTWERNGAWRDYESLFSAAAAVCPQSAKVQYNLAHMQTGKGDMDAAAAHYRQALLIHPAYYQALANLGSLLSRAGRRGEATELYERAISAQPSLGEAYYNLGFNLQSSGDSRSALPYMSTAARLQPDSADIAHGHANALQASGRLTDALALYRRSVALDPAFASAYNNIAACLLALAAASPVSASSNMLQALHQARAAYRHGPSSLPCPPPPFFWSSADPPQQHLS